MFTSIVMEKELYILLSLLLQSASSLRIMIDGDKGSDSTDCLRGLLPCHSLKYVADNTTNINVTDGLVIEIISSSLSLQGSVIFTGINGLTLNGKGANIKCNQHLNDGSGIVFNKCSNVKLKRLSIEHCGLLYQNKTYCGVHAILFYKCIKAIVTQTNFTNNNGIGLALYDVESLFIINRCIFLNNSYKHNYMRAGTNKKLPKKETLSGGALHLIQDKMHVEVIAITFCQFINNSATGSGGALYLYLNDKSGLKALIMNCQFTGNTADISGGAIAIAAYTSNSLIVGKGYQIDFYFCSIFNNSAHFGGGVALTVSHSNSASINTTCITGNTMRFNYCIFNGNKAKVTSAIDINGNNQKVSQSLNTRVIFYFCQFIGNIAGVDLKHSSHRYKGKSFKATLYAIDVTIEFLFRVSFHSNTGTALYIDNSRLSFGIRDLESHIQFINNTGDHGGAIMLTASAVLDVFPYSKVLLSNNTAVIGGAIYVQATVITHYIGTCFLHDVSKTSIIWFVNNTATGGIGGDIFVSTFQSCTELYNGNATMLFKNNIMGNFKFSSSMLHSVATAPVTLLINETQILPYPGLSYNMSITQLDELNNNITNLQLFPLSATLLNKQNSSSKIVLTRYVANNYIIVFKGIVGDKGTLTLQSNEYSATLSINVTLYKCPPGYIFLTDTCHCSYSITGLYYYGIVHCLEDKNAVITTGLWAGYLQEKFATADCVTSLCDYHNSTSNSYGEHILPLNYSFLNNHVCALHRTGVLCGSCINDYTTYLHSPNYQCGESTLCQYGPLFYILSEIIPVTGIFLVILFFNISLTSGALYSFIFYSQIVNNHYGNTLYQSYNGPLIYFFNAFKIVYGIFDLDIFEIDQLSFCLFKNATILDLMLIKYLTTLYALFLIIVTILVLRFYSFYCCIKLCHKCGRRNIRGSIVNALTAFLVLCYFHCLVITLHILVPSHIMGTGGTRMKTVPLYNGDLSYMSIDHLKYVIPAIVCLIVIILPPPIILLSEPLLVRVSGVLNIRRNAVTYTLHRLRMKLKPFLDSFQGCFKDNCRYFAGLFFLYRILLVLIPSMLTGGDIVADVTKGVLLFLILLLHSICRPFDDKVYNNLDSFLLIDLLMINLFTVTRYSTLNDSDDTNGNINTVTAVLQLFLMSLPLVYIVCFAFRPCLNKLKSATCKVDNRSAMMEDDDLSARLLLRPVEDPDDD